jgi:hypothetical protein
MRSLQSHVLASIILGIFVIGYVIMESVNHSVPSQYYTLVYAVAGAWAYGVGVKAGGNTSSSTDSTKSTKSIASSMGSSTGSSAVI